MTLGKTTQLHQGLEIATIGFRINPDSATIKQDIFTALNVGFRHFDLPANEHCYPQIAQAFQSSQIPRYELFFTAKIANQDHGLEKARHAIKRILKALKTDYIDLLLIDWPNPKAYRNVYPTISIETWTALEEAYKSGNAHAIGVANYEARHIEHVLTHAEIAPMVNQARLYPGFPFEDNLTCANMHNIQSIGYLPYDHQAITSSKEIQIFANKYRTTPENICARYVLDKHCLVLVYSQDEKILQQYQSLYDFTLSKEDIQYMDVMKNYGLPNIDPDTCPF